MKALLSADSPLLGARKRKDLPVAWIAIWALTVLIADAAQEGDFTYWDSGASITIAGYTGSGGAVAIPAAILGKPVISIEGYAFEGCTGLTSVIVPPSVTSIGDGSFRYCFGLTTVTIGESVTNIGQAAFEGCSSLASVTIPDSVTSLGGMAFYGCTGLTSVTIGNSVTNINNGAFAGCQSLASVMIGSGVTAIATPYIHWGPMPWSVPGAFSGCTGLRTLYFLGNAPGDNSELEFEFGDRATIFYRAGATGWGSTFRGRPAVLWIPTDDLDHDRANNLEEMMAGTDPMNASSRLFFESVPRPEALVEADQTDVPAGQHALYFQTIPGMRYEILSSETWGEWTTAAAVSATTSQKRALVSKPLRMAFYRIRVLP